MISLNRDQCFTPGERGRQTRVACSSVSAVRRLLRLPRWDERKKEQDAEEVAVDDREKKVEWGATIAPWIVGRERSKQSAFHTPSFVPCPRRPRYFISIRHYFLASLCALLMRASQNKKVAVQIIFSKTLSRRDLMTRTCDAIWKLGIDARGNWSSVMNKCISDMKENY